MASKFGMGIVAVVALGVTLPEPHPDQPSQTTATTTAVVDLEACRDAWRKTHPVPDEILQTSELLHGFNREQQAGSETVAELPEMTDEEKAELLVAERDIQRWRTMDERDFIHSFRDTLKQVCAERTIDLVLQKRSDPKVREELCGIRLPDLSTPGVLYASEKVEITDIVMDKMKQSE